MRNKSFWLQTKDTGSMVGGIAWILIVISILTIAFLGIGSWNSDIQGYANIFLAGLFLTLFFWLPHQKSRDGTKSEYMNVKSSTKQLTVVLPCGLLIGIIVVYANFLVGVSTNLLYSSTLGISLALLAGTGEELLFRGGLQTAFSNFGGGTLTARIIAVFPTALIFSLFHYFAVQTIQAFIVIFVIGVIFGLSHAISNDIGIPMLAHTINNVFAIGIPVVVGLLQDYLILICVALIVFYFIMVMSTPNLRRGR